MTILETWNEPSPVKLTVADFLHLADFGAFQDYGKVELIEGVIVAINAQYSTHARVKSWLFRRIADAVDAAMPGYEAWAEATVALGTNNAPEPDILVTSFVAAERAPVPVETVALIVEVADTTLTRDLNAKARLYARFGVPEYWVVDVNGRTIVQLWSADADAYAEQRTVPFEERVTAATIPGLSVTTSGLSR